MYTIKELREFKEKSVSTSFCYNTIVKGEKLYLLEESRLLIYDINSGQKPRVIWLRAGTFRYLVQIEGSNMFAIQYLPMDGKRRLLKVNLDSEALSYEVLSETNDEYSRKDFIAFYRRPNGELRGCTTGQKHYEYSFIDGTMVPLKIEDSLVPLDYVTEGDTVHLLVRSGQKGLKILTNNESITNTTIEYNELYYGGSLVLDGTIYFLSIPLKCLIAENGTRIPLDKEYWWRCHTGNGYLMRKHYDSLHLMKIESQ